MVEANLNWCSVTLSEVAERGKRIEASVYDVEGKKAKEVISRGKYPLRTITGTGGYCSAYTCERFKRIWVENSEYPIFQPSSICDIMPIPDGYLSKKTNTDIEALRVHKGQILLTCSGTIGKVCYVSDTLDNCIFSHDLLRITCKSQDDAGYIYAYLKTKIGNTLLLTNKYGAVITHIEAEHLDSVPVPDAPLKIKKIVNDKIIKSYVLQDESNNLIIEATKLLKEELKIDKFDDLPVKQFDDNISICTFEKKLSEMNRRLDTSYHIPIVEAILKTIEENSEEITNLGDDRISQKIVLAGVFKRVYVDEGYGYPFLGGKEITQLNPKTQKFLSKPIHKSRYEKELKIEENTILVTDRGTIGITALVPKHWANYAVSQNVLKLVPANEDIAGYIYIFLSSDVGKMLIRRQTYGSVVDMIDDSSLAAVEIPLLKNKTTQNTINKLALQAKEKRYEASILEEEAIKLVEEKIIKDVK